MATEPEITIDLPALRAAVSDESDRLHEELTRIEEHFRDRVLRALRVTPLGDGRYTLKLEHTAEPPEQLEQPEMPAEATA